MKFMFFVLPTVPATLEERCRSFKVLDAIVVHGERDLALEEITIPEGLLAKK
jgi:hypothetical protein